MTAGSVFVIDAKKYVGAVEKPDVGPFFRLDERLYVGGRNRSKLITGVARQVEGVHGAVAATELGPIAVRGVLRLRRRRLAPRIPARSSSTA